MKNPLPSNTDIQSRLLLLGVLLLLTSPAYATIRYVDATRSSDSGNGLSWVTARKYLQTALDDAVSGDQIWVAQGTYKPTTSTTDRSASFIMKEGVKIYGGFTSGQTALSQRNPNPATNSTVLSGDINGDNVLAGNSYHVILNNQNGLTAAAVLDGFTIAGGNADGPNASAVGGGIYNYTSSPTLTNCSFLNNFAVAGGGIYNTDSSVPTLTNCSFLNNSANQGGGILNRVSSSPTLTNCSFLNNSAVYEGGGIFNVTSSSPTLTNCSFLSNTADQGGGMYSTNLSEPALTNCSFLNNTAGQGGGLYNRSAASPTLTNCVLFGNGGQGTIVNMINSTVTAAYSLFEDTETDYTGSNNLTTAVSPFVSTTSAQLRVCSPAIDAGDNAANATTTDLAGNNRKLRAIDMGAYEFQGALTQYTATLGGGGTITSGQSSNLIVTLSGGVPPYTLVYSDGSTSTTVPNYTSGANIAVSPTVTTTYSLVSVSDASGCTAGTLSGNATVTVQAGPQTHHVNLARPDDSGNGLTWATAHKYLQTALADAQSGDQIWVAQGIYKPTTSTTDRTISFVMKEGVKIYGGFSSGQLNLTDRNSNPATNGTVLSGDINNDNALAGNSHHVIYNNQNGLTAAAVLDGFTVTGGNTGGAQDSAGGGMLNFSSSPTLTNCSFVNNSTGNFGGGISNISCSPTLTNCSFLNNFAGVYGGGIYNSNKSSPSLTNCSFEGNSTNNHGGGMYNANNSSPSFTNCSFLNNSAVNLGGGMFNISGSPTLTNCSFLNNIANQGGSISNFQNSSLSLTNCVLFGNGGQKSIFNFDANNTVTATYTLFEASATNYTGSDNLATTVSPFISTTSTELNPGSLAIGAGNNAAYNGPSTDLAGNPRTVNSTIDMGAYEFQGPVSHTRHVNLARPDDSGDGLSWATAHKYLQTALAAAQSGDQIWVAQGIYKPTTSTTDRTVSFVMKEGVKIYGGFTSGQLNLTDRNTNPATNGTVLSGDINSDNDKVGNSYHVIFNDQNGLTAAAVLDGFTVRDGFASSSFYKDRGGGIFNSSSSPALTNCSFQDNSAHIGGGMYNTTSSPALTNCSFQDNSAYDSGGGLYNIDSSNPTLTNCSFQDNSASNNSGGGLYNVNGSSPTLTNCSFSQNNSAYYGGGLLNLNNSSPTLTNCSFQGNSANFGGGFYNLSNSNSTLINCSFQGNSATNGGGMINSESSPALINCSFQGNLATSTNGVRGMLNANSSSPTLTNCVLFGNGGQNTIVNAGNSTLTASYSLFEASETDYTGSNNLTTTVSPFVSATNAQLSPCSPAIDTGLNTANATTIDLAGNQRLINGTIDMGAYEFQIGQNNFQRNWIGSVNSNWNEPNNWGSGCVPTSIDGVIVNASPHNPVVGSGITVDAGVITLNVDTTLTVDIGGTLNVHGNGGTPGTINMNGGNLAPWGIIKYQ